MPPKAKGASSAGAAPTIKKSGSYTMEVPARVILFAVGLKHAAHFGKREAKQLAKLLVRPVQERRAHFYTASHDLAQSLRIEEQLEGLMLRIRKTGGGADRHPLVLHAPKSVADVWLPVVQSARGSQLNARPMLFAKQVAQVFDKVFRLLEARWRNALPTLAARGEGVAASDVHPPVHMQAHALQSALLTAHSLPDAIAGPTGMFGPGRP